MTTGSQAPNERGGQMGRWKGKGGKKKRPGLAPGDSDKFHQSSGVKICLILAVGAQRGRTPSLSHYLTTKHPRRAASQVRLAAIHPPHTQTPGEGGGVDYKVAVKGPGHLKMQPQPPIPTLAAECSWRRAVLGGGGGAKQSWRPSSIAFNSE